MKTLIIGLILFLAPSSHAEFHFEASTNTVRSPMHTVGTLFRTDALTAAVHVAVIQDKNRDRLIGYLRGRESYARDIGATKGETAPDYAVQVEFYPGGCKERYKTYEDIPRHSVPCTKAGKDAWLIYYTDDFK